MNIMDFALDTRDWNFVNKVREIAIMSSNQINDGIVREEIIPHINTMTENVLEYYFPIMVYALNNSDSFTESFLQEKLNEMQSRKRDLFRETAINQINESKNK